MKKVRINVPTVEINSSNRVLCRFCCFWAFCREFNFIRSIELIFRFLLIILSFLRTFPIVSGTFSLAFCASSRVISWSITIFSSKIKPDNSWATLFLSTLLNFARSLFLASDSEYNLEREYSVILLPRFIFIFWSV